MALGVEVAAEVAGGDGAGDRAGRRVDADRRIGGAHLGVGGANEKRGGLVGRVGEAGGARAGRRGEVGCDPGGQTHLVVAGLGRLVGVTEVGRVDGVLGVTRGRGGDLPGVREERDVAAAARAAGARHVGEAEAADAGGVVLVTAGRGRARGVASGVLGAPGEHAERGDGAREDVAAVPGADERVDVRGRVPDEVRWGGGGGRRRGGRQGGGGAAGRENGGEQQGRRTETHDAAPPPSDGSRITGRTSRRDSSVRQPYHGRVRTGARRARHGHPDG